MSPCPCLDPRALQHISSPLSSRGGGVIERFSVGSWLLSRPNQNRQQSVFRGMTDPSSIHADCFWTCSSFLGAQKCQSDLVQPRVPWVDFLTSFNIRRNIALSSFTRALDQCQEVWKGIFQRNVDLH